MNHSTLCIGADVHLDEIVLCLVDKADGHEVADPFRVTNNLPGAQAAATAIAEIATDLGYARTEIGWEATGMLWIPFHRYLSCCPQLQPFERELVCLNPQLVTKFQDGLVLRRPKNDKLSASAIAARLRFGELPLSYVPGDFWQGLRRLTRYRFHLSRNLSREKMRFQSYAFLKCSDWKRVKGFSDVFGATSVALLTEFTVAEITEMTHDQLVDLVSRRGRGRFEDPTSTARKVHEALRSSYNMCMSGANPPLI
jgi:transposase